MTIQRTCPVFGWTLVRALAPGGSRGHPATDDLAGTDVYGDPSVSAASGGARSIDFERALPGTAGANHVGWNNKLRRTNHP